MTIRELLWGIGIVFVWIGVLIVIQRSIHSLFMNDEEVQPKKEMGTTETPSTLYEATGQLEFGDTFTKEESDEKNTP